MECSETYKNWVKYLKIKGLYCEYLYTMGKVVDHNFFIIFSPKDRPKPDKAFIVNSVDIACSPFWSPKMKEVTKADLMRIMRQVDSRVSSINNVYRYQEYVQKVFIKDITWTTVVKEFFIHELRQKYGDEAFERMYKRMEIRREQLRKAEEERKRKLWEEFLGDSRTIEPRGGWYFEFPDAPLAETARTAATYTGVPRHRNREEGGQWYDRININRNNIRRQDRWRFRR